MLLYKTICTSQEHVIDLCNKVIEIELLNDTNSYFIDKLARIIWNKIKPKETIPYTKTHDYTE